MFMQGAIMPMITLTLGRSAISRRASTDCTCWLIGWRAHFGFLGGHIGSRL